MKEQNCQHLDPFHFLSRETREELGKAVGEAFFPLSDVPDIQAEFLRQVEEQEERERKKKEEEEKAAVEQLGKSLGEVALVQSGGQVPNTKDLSSLPLP